MPAHVGWYTQWRRPGAEFGGDGEILRGPRFLNDVFFGKLIFIFAPNISDDLLLVVDQVFRIFPFLSQIFRVLTMLNVVYDPFLIRKTLFFTLFVLSRASDIMFLTILGGRMRGPSPTSNFWGTVPPVPLSLRPWVYVCNVFINHQQVCGPILLCIAYIHLCMIVRIHCRLRMIVFYVHFLFINYWS